MKNVIVTVSGQAGSGKTTVITAIQKALAELGATVTVETEDPLRDASDLSEYNVSIREQQLLRVEV
jgi:uridine kinase